MQTAIMVSFHNYCPMYEHKFFDVLLDFFLHSFNKYWRDEVDRLYLLDSGWDIEIDDPKITIIKSNTNTRYYDAYKKALPRVSEDLIGFLDNDMIIYREGIIKDVFNKLSREGKDVLSIYDNCGTYKTDKLNGKNKFCPYFFFTKTELLKKYIDCEWGPKMPEYETLGKLTEKMLEDGIKPEEMEEDKTSIYLTDNGIIKHGNSKNLGYYHIRAGSTPAYLLTTRYYGLTETYERYIKFQPRTEYLRQMAWYLYMLQETETELINEFMTMIQDVSVDPMNFIRYLKRFKEFHGLCKKTSGHSLTN